VIGLPAGCADTGASHDAQAIASAAAVKVLRGMRFIDVSLEKLQATARARRRRACTVSGGTF
jgi:hypothetical protein